MTALPGTPPDSSHRSTLVTVVAWLFIIFSALATFGALIGFLVLAGAPAATVNSAVNRVAQDTLLTHVLPAPYLFMLHHVYLWSFVKLAWWAVVLSASIGILRRKEWARRTFVGVLAIEVVVLIVAFFVGQSIVVTLGTQIASKYGSNELPPGMGSGIALAGLLVVCVIAVLLWLFVSFRSTRVREEFAHAGRAP
jgi:hypothetical protein